MDFPAIEAGGGVESLHFGRHFGVCGCKQGPQCHQTINAVISETITVAVMLAASSPRILAAIVLALKWQVLGWAATVAMGTATIAMFAGAWM